MQLKHNPRDVSKGYYKRATKKAIGNPERGKEGDVFIYKILLSPSAHLRPLVQVILGAILTMVLLREQTEHAGGGMFEH